MVHEPFFFAVSTQANPAGAINPSAVSRSTFSLLIFDHVPVGFRLLKNWVVRSSSSFFLMLSIQPKHRASSTAALQVMVGLPVCFLYWMSHTPCFVPWFSRSHCCHSALDSV